MEFKEHKLYKCNTVKLAHYLIKDAKNQGFFSNTIYNSDTKIDINKVNTFDVHGHKYGDLLKRFRNNHEYNHYKVIIVTDKMFNR